MEFLVALYRRFRVKVSPQQFPCLACGIRVMDQYGDHGTLCNTTAQNAKRRHNIVRDLLMKMGKSAGLDTTIEQNPTTTTSNIKPADVLFENYENGTHLAVDVTIVSPFRAGVDPAAVSQYMYTGDQAYVAKLNTYADCTFKHGVNFQPFVIEEFGAIHSKGLDIFNRLCKFIAIRKNCPVTQIKFHYSKLLSSTIQRQNSRAILSRLS